MKKSDLLKGLCLVIAVSLLQYKRAYASDLREQLTYLYFFSAITVLFFYRARMSQ